jgi:hypothetical protein
MGAHIHTALPPGRLEDFPNRTELVQRHATHTTVASSQRALSKWISDGQKKMKEAPSLSQLPNFIRLWRTHNAASNSDSRNVWPFPEGVPAGWLMA